MSGNYIILPGIHLPDRLVKRYSDAVSEIEAAHVGVRHGNGQTRISVHFQQFLRQASSLRAEYKKIAGIEPPLGIYTVGLGGEVHKSGGRVFRVEILEIEMAMKPDLIPIIEAGTFQRTVIHSKPGHADDMKVGECRRAKTRYISCIWRYFRL